MKAELDRCRTALAERQKEVLVLKGDVEDLEKRLDKISQAIMVEYEKIDAALDRG